MDFTDVVLLQMNKDNKHQYTFDYKDCHISLLINTSGPPSYAKRPDHPSIHIDTIACSTLGTGNGKKLLCSAIIFLKREFAYGGDTEVKLRAVSSWDMDRRAAEGKNKNLEGLSEDDKSWEKHKKLVNYYKRYGFDVIDEYKERDLQRTDFGSYVAPMIARLDSITEHCSAQPILPVFIGEIPAWECPRCSLVNAKRVAVCMACELPFPGKIALDDPELIVLGGGAKGGGRRRTRRKRRAGN
jgi:hypothetical protein